MKTASLQEWESIGAQAKQTRDELFKLLNQTSGKLPVALNNHLINSIKQLDKFRSQAENRMLQTGASTDLGLFYGGTN